MSTFALNQSTVSILIGAPISFIQLNGSDEERSRIFNKPVFWNAKNLPQIVASDSFGKKKSCHLTPNPEIYMFVTIAIL